MTKPANDPAEQADVVVSTRVTERIVERECDACGTRFEPVGRGRPPKYCSDPCRQRAWALREAARKLGQDDPRPQVVREVVERATVVVRARPAPVTRLSAPTVLAEPTTGRGWVELLGVLAAQLQDPGHVTANNHWHHPKLYDALVHAMAALGRAHPGGLEQLSSKKPGRRP